MNWSSSPSPLRLLTVSKKYSPLSFIFLDLFRRLFNWSCVYCCICLRNWRCMQSAIFLLFPSLCHSADGFKLKGREEEKGEGSWHLNCSEITMQRAPKYYNSCLIERPHKTWCEYSSKNVIRFSSKSVHWWNLDSTKTKAHMRVLLSVQFTSINKYLCVRAISKTVTAWRCLRAHEAVLFFSHHIFVRFTESFSISLFLSLSENLFKHYYAVIFQHINVV